MLYEVITPRGQPNAAESRCKARDRYEIAEVVRWYAEHQIRRESHRSISMFEDGFEMEHDFDHRDGDYG